MKITTTQAAERLGTTPARVRALMRAGALTDVGNRDNGKAKHFYLFDDGEVEAVRIAELPLEPPTNGTVPHDVQARILRQFAGYLSACLPELGDVEMGRFETCVQAFVAREPSGPGT